MAVVFDGAPEEVAADDVVWDREAHQLRRYAARMIDALLFGSPIAIILIIALGVVFPAAGDWVMADGEMQRLLVAVPLRFICAIPGIAAVLAWKGTTPGKWLFGIRVTVDEGDRNFGRMLKREALVAILGVGLGLPLFAFVTMIKSYGDVEKGGTTVWDSRVGTEVEGQVIDHWTLRLRLAIGTLIWAAVMIWGIAARMLSMGQT